MLEQIREIIAENLAIDVEKVTESADFKEDLDADSGRRPSDTQNSRRRSEIRGST